MSRFSRGQFLIILLFFTQWLLLDSLGVPTWDGVFYYANVRSPIFSGDLHFGDDIRAAYPTSGDHFSQRQLDQAITTTGYVTSPFAVGTALFWVLPTAIVHSITKWRGIETSGYEWYYVRLLAGTTAMMGLALYLLGHRFLREWVSERIPLFATITLMFATSLLHYQFRNPFYSHVASALTTALCVIYWWDSHKNRSLQRQFWLGALIGLSALVRWQHLIYAVLPFCSGISLWLALPRTKKSADLRPLISEGLSCALGITAVFSLQLAIWHLFYGAWLTVPQGESFMVWLPLWIGPLIFSPFHGLVAWMPIALPSLVGLGLLGRKQPQLAIPLMLVVLLELYIGASSRDWFGAGGYGARRLTSEWLIFLLGYGYLAQTITQRIGRIFFLPLLSMGLIWHQWTLLRYGFENQLGGHVVSMYPDYRWAEDDWPTFLQELWQWAAYLWQHPSDFLGFTNSPWTQLWHGQWAWTQLYGIGISLIVWGGVIIIWRGIRPKITPMAMPIFLLLVLCCHLWIGLKA